MSVHEFKSHVPQPKMAKNMAFSSSTVHNMLVKHVSENLEKSKFKEKLGKKHKYWMDVIFTLSGCSALKTDMTL